MVAQPEKLRKTTATYKRVYGAGLEKTEGRGARGRPPTLSPELWEFIAEELVGGRSINGLHKELGISRDVIRTVKQHLERWANGESG